MTDARIHQINSSPGGVPKLPIEGPVEVRSRGVAGDAHNDRLNHGGPDQALCLYSLEVIEALQAEDHPIEPGFVGENVTVAGLDWAALGPGDQLKLGDEVVAERTAPATPCAKNRAWFIDGNYRRMDAALHPGWARWYARVIEVGTIQAGDPVTVSTPDRAE